MNKRKNNAVSEILSSVLLLGIATSFLAGLYFTIISNPAPTASPLVEVSGKFSDNKLILTHHGGEPIDINSEVILTLGGKTKNMFIKDFLNVEDRKNGYWDFSEEFVYPVFFDFDYKIYPHIGINVLDLEKNSIVFGGEDIEITPTGDLDIDVVLNNDFVKKGDTLIFNITACNNGNINASDILVNFVVPEELVHISNYSKEGFFDNKTGMWKIDTIPAEGCAKLQINASPADTGSKKLTQLTMLLDGSGSISSSDFNLQIDGLSKAIENPEIFPHDEKVELTVIQFGGKDTYIAELQVGPIIVNKSNVESVVKQVRDINQMTGYTPTSCSLYLGADVMYKSPNNPINGGIFERQVTILVTDGDPTACDDGSGIYTAYRGSGCNPKTSAEKAREYMIKKLELNTTEEDQINIIAVGKSQKFGPWLRSNIAWPGPGVFAPPFILDDPYYGWVRNVTTYSEFSATIDELFGIVFHKVSFSAEISSDYLSDPMSFNNKANGFLVAYNE